MIAALLIAAWSFIALKLRKSAWFKRRVVRLFGQDQKDES